MSAYEAAVLTSGVIEVMLALVLTVFAHTVYKFVLAFVSAHGTSTALKGLARTFRITYGAESVLVVVRALLAALGADAVSVNVRAFTARDEKKCKSKQK